VFRSISALAIAACLAAPAPAREFDRGAVRKEPAYRGKPGYLLLAFGPKGADRAWVVNDGDTLYVDRNGDGDLTAPGEKVSAAANALRDPAESGYSFNVGELRLGGKVHKAVTVSVTPLKLYADNPALGNLPAIRRALAADPSARVVTVRANVESARLKGAGIGGRIVESAGFYDLDGVLRFAPTPAAAPVVRFDGPLEITFSGSLPTLRCGRDTDLTLAVGTPGHGPGTFAELYYQDTIPETAYPRVTVAYPPAVKGGPPVRAEADLKARC